MACMKWLLFALSLVSSSPSYIMLIIDNNTTNIPSTNHESMINQYLHNDNNNNNNVIILPSNISENALCSMITKKNMDYVLFLFSNKGLSLQSCHDIQLVSVYENNNMTKYKIISSNGRNEIFIAGKNSRNLIAESPTAPTTDKPTTATTTTSTTAPPAANPTVQPLSFIDYEVWISPSTPLLPHSVDGGAICSEKDTIFMFGGYSNDRMVQFDIRTQTMTDIGFGVNVNGFGQLYSQINHLCYWIDMETSGGTIVVYDLETKTISTDNITLPSEGNVGSGGCLTSHDQLLFVVGGDNNYKTIQIYNISSETWLFGKSMQFPRTGCSCIVHPVYKALYAIGGYVGMDSMDEVEKILIDDVINGGSWQYIGDLIAPLMYTRAVVYEDTIMIIGGREMRWSNPSDQVIVINCTNDQMYVGGKLAYGVTYTAAILMNQRLYAFGGGSDWSKWQYLDLIVSPTTAAPTTDKPTTDKPTTDKPSVLSIYDTSLSIKASPTTLTFLLNTYFLINCIK